MAIKGKKRSRGGRSRARVVAPRPTLVVPKQPFFRRTWVRVALVALLVLAVSGITFGVILARREAAEREAAQREVTRVGEELEAALAPVAQFASDSVLLLPELEPTIAHIQGGTAPRRQVERRLGRWETQLRAVSEDLQAIETDRPDLRRSMARIEDGLDMYTVILRSVATLLELEQQRRIDNAVIALQPQLQTAASTVQSGFLIYLNERVDVGLEGRSGITTELPGTNPLDIPGPGEVPMPEAPAPQPTG